MKPFFVLLLSSALFACGGGSPTTALISGDDDETDASPFVDGTHLRMAKSHSYAKCSFVSSLARMLKRSLKCLSNGCSYVERGSCPSLVV